MAFHLPAAKTKENQFMRIYQHSEKFFIKKVYKLDKVRQFFVVLLFHIGLQLKSSVL